jgi:hypothetical protein
VALYLPSEIQGDHRFPTQSSLYLTFRSPGGGFRASPENTEHPIVCVLALELLGLRHTGEFFFPLDLEVQV